MLLKNNLNISPDYLVYTSLKKSHSILNNKNVTQKEYVCFFLFIIHAAHCNFLIHRRSETMVLIASFVCMIAGSEGSSAFTKMSSAFTKLSSAFTRVSSHFPCI